MADYFPRSFKVRPRDKWDGASTTVTHESADWNSAVVEVRLRLATNGAEVRLLDPTLTVSGTSLQIQYGMTGEQTAELEMGRTYRGEVRVWVPSANPAEPPDFGPYTVETFTLQGVAHPVTEEIDGLTVTLASGGANGADGADGAGFQLGFDLYMHPTSGHVYMHIDGLYYRMTPVLVDGQPSWSYDTTGTADPT